MALKPKQIEREPTEFEVARDKHKAILAEYEAAVAGRDALKLAMSIARDKPKDLVPAVKAQTTDELIRLAERRPEKAAERFRDLQFDVEELHPKMMAANQEWARARRIETNRIARELQPAQREAVRKIAKALEQLSIALEEEPKVRAQLAMLAPEPTSSFLPDCSHELAGCSLASPATPASAWARRMRSMKVF